MGFTEAVSADKARGATETSPILPHTSDAIASLQISRQDLSPYNLDAALISARSLDLENGSLRRQQQQYFNLFLWFFWNYLVPQRMRNYFANHRTVGSVFVALVLGSIAFLLYHTGNLGIFSMYLKLVLCFLFGGDESSAGMFGFCWA